jgi:hypothetical protein
MQAVGRPYVMAGVALAGASLVAVTPLGSPDLPRVSDAAVRLTSGGTDLLGGLTGDLSGLTSDLSGLTGGLSGLDLGSLDLGSLGGLFADGSILNLPYNFIADIINIPYEESLALQEYAYALGPAGSIGGVEGWIPPGTAPEGIAETVGQQGFGDYYALGGTGSWYMESMGNTWGWDNGNWPQVDALVHFLLPFQWTEGITNSIQSIAQSSFIDGAAVNCEFECANVLGYLGGWLTHLGQVFDSTYPTTLTDTIGQNSATGVVNVGPPGFEDTAIWSGEPTINPFLAPIQAIWDNSTASPASDPIMLPNLVDVFDNLTKLSQDQFNDFSPFVDGSFLYWGAPTLYSFPALIGGLVQNFTNVPNQFVDIGQWQPNGAEPLWGYESNPLTLLSPTEGLPAGLEYLAQGLEGYLNPTTYLEAINADLSELGLGTLSADLTGLGPAGATLPADLLGSFDPSTLLSSFDPSTLLGGLDPTTIATDLSTLLSNAASDFGATLGPDLALNALTALL